MKLNSLLDVYDLIEIDDYGNFYLNQYEKSFDCYFSCDKND